MTDPAVTVLMPIFNAEAYLEEAIESILAQSYRDMEFLVVNDGSTDRSEEIVRRYRDPRIILVTQPNKGLVAALERGLQEARGRYIARMDGDDRSSPERIERQVAFLEEHPAVGLVGTGAEIWVGGARSGREHRHPESDPLLRFELLFDNPFVHSSVMMRRDVLLKTGGYRPGDQFFPEDYDLWSRMADVSKVANIPEILHIYREVPTSVCRKDPLRRIARGVANISCRNLSFFLRDAPVAEEIIRSFTMLFHDVDDSIVAVGPLSLPEFLRTIYDEFSRRHVLSGDQRAYIVRRLGRFLARVYKNSIKRRMFRG